MLQGLFSMGIARRLSRFARLVLWEGPRAAVVATRRSYGDGVSSTAPTKGLPFSESAFSRARREWGGAVMSWFRVWAWLALWGLGGVAASTYFSSGYKAVGQTVIVVSCTAGALLLGLFTSFFLVWMSVVKIQRDEVRKAYSDLQERLDQRPELGFKHRFRLPMLTIDVTVNGSTITNAVMHLVVPRTVMKVWRVGDDSRHLSTGAVRWAETEIAGEEAIYWDERNVTLDGFGTINQFRFELFSFGRDTGSIPFVFKIGSELLGGWEEYAAAIEAGASGF
jgi:hypothetical protein